MSEATLEAPVSRHKCMIYDGHPKEQLPVIVPLLLNGLRDGRKCLYLGDPGMVGAVSAALAEAGVDVPREIRRQALLLSSDRSHLDGGSFDPAAMVGMLRRLIDDAVQAGFTGLCATGDMRWELGADRNFDRLLEYEALLEQVFRDRPLVGICQYHRDSVPAKALRDALFTHRSLYLGAELNRDNLFYIPPEILLQSRIEGDVGRWMCDQITRILQAERERDKALDEQRRLAEKLAALNRDLERRVQERTVELESANRELEAFSSSVSHDLRAPLRAILGFGRMLAEDQGPALDPEGKRRLGIVIDNAGRMGEMIDSLLDFSRAGRTAMRIGPVDMTALANRVIDDHSAATGAKAKVRVLALPEAAGDASLLQQVLANLIGNAIKYSGKRPDPLIEVGGRKGGIENAYWVKDNGAGFDMRQADKLFGVFQRLHARSEYEENGVGLALCKRIVERHGGRIWAESSEGQGATFHFTLPCPAGSA